jgi:hypothetical protein
MLFFVQTGEIMYYKYSPEQFYPISRPCIPANRVDPLIIPFIPIQNYVEVVSYSYQT